MTHYTRIDNIYIISIIVNWYEKLWS